MATPREKVSSVDPIWNALRQQAEAMAGGEPSLASFVHATILQHDRLEEALSYHLAHKLGGEDLSPTSRGSVEYLRRDRNGQPRDTRYALVSPEEAYSPRYENDYGPQGFQPWGVPWRDPYRVQPRPLPSPGGLFGLFQRRDDPQWRSQQPQQWQQQRYQQPQRRLPAYPPYQDRF